MDIDKLENTYVSVLQRHRDLGKPISFVKAGQTKEDQDLETYYTRTNIPGFMDITDPETCCCAIYWSAFCLPLCLYFSIFNYLCPCEDTEIRGYVQGVRRYRYVLFSNLIVKLNLDLEEKWHDNRKVLMRQVKIMEKVELSTNDTTVSEFR